MRKFYEGVLNFRPQFEDNDFVTYELGGVNIALLGDNVVDEMCGTSVFTKGGKSSHLLALEVNDLIKSIKSLKKLQVKIVKEPKKTSWGQHVAYISDPEGNIIELSEPYEEKQFKL